MRLSSWPPDRFGASTVARICGLLAISLWPAAARAAATAGDYFVHSLPGAPDGPLVKMHAGLIEVNEQHHGNLFFWHFQNKHIANRQRTVIWLNGGPGCSSEDGALMEIGPYRLKDSEHLQYNEGSWHEFANVMFVDNPVGTGLSSVDSDGYLHELPEMADQFVVFLEKWFALFPEYEHDDLYFAGESYAGQHIPYIVKAVLERNKKGPRHIWNLKGMLIGNGWISPAEQYLSYLPYSYKSGILERSSDIANKVERQQAVCVKALGEEGGADHVDLPVCEDILQDILRLTMKPGPDGQQCINMYDVRLRDSYPSCGMNWPPDLVYVTPYLRRKDVLDALHIPSSLQQPGWQECNGAVSGAFRARNSKPSIQILPRLVEQVPTVLFSGASDLICNHLGTEDLINNMEWNGLKGFEISPGTWAPRREWTFEGEVAGLYQSARNLTYVLFYNSSHMVPFDYARRTRDMLDRFMNVDIANIGGQPADSRIDGEKGLETSVGGHPNSTIGEAAEKAKLDAAKWSAYYKSGEIALVVVAALAAVWGWYIWKERRKMKGYTGVRGETGIRSGMGLESFRQKRSGGDVEAGDFDEAELDDLHVVRTADGRRGDVDRYSVGSLSDDEEGAKESMNRFRAAREK